MLSLTTKIWNISVLQNCSPKDRLVGPNTLCNLTSLLGFTKVNKCEWHKDSVEFLGYILKIEGLTIAEDKVKIICKWPKPQKVKDIQSFLSFTNFLLLLHLQLLGHCCPTHPSHP